VYKSNEKEGEIMKRIYVSLFGLTVCLSFVIASLCPGAYCAETCEQWVAKVVSVEGTVESRRVGETGWQAAKLNDTYCPGDMIRVQERSRADIALANQPVLRLDQNTTITLGGVKEERTSVIQLAKGAAHFFSRVRRGLEVNTAFVNAGVEGTEFFVRVDEDKAFISIFEGKVLASNEAGSLILTSGQSAVAEAGQAPVLRIVARPRDAVRWALYYPPAIYFHPDEFKSETGWLGMVRESLEFYMRGETQKAFDSIKQAPEDIRDPRFFVYRASLLLYVGRVDEAGADIERALSLDPKNSNAFALQSIVAVVQNEKEKALDLAGKAVGADPKSASARIALSYAQQSSFNLEGARNSLKEAVQLSPDNALAWARLAELRLSFGELDGALEDAQRAVAVNPDLSRTQTVLGFAYLTQVKTEQSKDAFGKAIELDQADPLPRLGLGLAKIRESDLHGGGRDIEIAASLDPNNSLIRSYLGKAYFEEKRTERDGAEYAIAKELDPQDPTPWFYDAIRKQTVNRPVEALRDLQRAIELNDNRAVYRSRLLLDSDLAARSASLGRIYSDLGFQQLALVEGWKSANTDPSNFSAHRFLADSYSVLPRHEIARVSELLQSQLLQPINMTPIQPRLAESNLFLVSSGGPADVSFNEFNPLFNRDRFTMQANGMVGENSTRGGENVVSGIYKNASFSAGGFHFETDGFRENADQVDDIANAFFQLELTHQTSIQAEYRYRDTEKGDTQLRFFEDDFIPSMHQKEETDSLRFGFHHGFSPGSDLIGSFVYQEADASVDFKPSSAMQDDPILRLIDAEADEDSYMAELQHLLRTKYFHLISGAGYSDVGSTQSITREAGLPLPEPLRDLSPFVLRDEETQHVDVEHTNVYLYSNIYLTKDVTVTVGGSLDLFKSDLVDEDQWNPKFGITWNPLPSTTFRAAAFRVLKRTLTTNQTIEPTQVAGFNQFFDDFNATESWRYGGALDHRFSRDLYGGVEFSTRDLDVPFFDIPDPPARPIPTVRTVDWQEYLGRVYLYWIPHEWLALKAEYQYEELERDQEFGAGLREVDTHKVPLGINFSHPSGLTTALQATYYDQNGEFLPQGRQPVSRNFLSGDDQFWVIDAAISYRLPKRYGFFTVGVKNLFDESFEYYDTDMVNPTIQPDRVIFGKVTLAFN
jgi:tetratricopeptide (TPR) repeat protein